MRAIYILSILLIITLNGCATIEIAKEVTKVGDSIKTTIQKSAKKQNDSEKTEAKRLVEEPQKLDLVKDYVRNLSHQLSIVSFEEVPFRDQILHLVI